MQIRRRFWIVLLVVASLWLPITVTHAIEIPEFIRGDVNGDGKINITDVTFLMASAKTGYSALHCLDAGDVNDDGGLIVTANGAIVGPSGPSDSGLLLAWLLALNPVGSENTQLPPPFPIFGTDPSGLDPLDCGLGGVAAPSLPDNRYHIAVSASPTVFESGDAVALQVAVTTNAAVHGFSIAFLVKTSLLEVGGVAFLDAGEQPLVAWDLKPSDDSEYGLLTIAVVLLGSDLLPVPSPLTDGSVLRLPVLEVGTTVKPGVPGGTHELAKRFDGAYGGIGTVGGVADHFSGPGGIPHLPGELPGGLSGYPLGQVGEIEFLRGDANGDGLVDIVDPFYTLSAIFQRIPSFPGHRSGADVTDDGNVNILDATSTLDFLFRTAFVPKYPFPRCGRDPTAPSTLEFEVQDPPDCFEN